jgi:hypothetical protein
LCWILPGVRGSHSCGGSSGHSWRCVRVYIHFCWNKKCVRDIHLMKLYLFVFHNTDTFYLLSPLSLTLCVLINENGVDSMMFRLTGKSPRQNLKTKLTSMVRFV